MIQDIELELALKKLKEAITQKQLLASSARVNYYVIAKNKITNLRDIVRYDQYSNGLFKQQTNIGFAYFTDVDLRFVDHPISKPYSLLPFLISTLSVPEYAVYRRNVFSWQALMKYIYGKLFSNTSLVQINAIEIKFYNVNRTKMTTIRNPEVADYKYVVVGVRYREGGAERIALEVADLDAVWDRLNLTSEVGRRTSISINGNTAVVETTFSHRIFADRLNQAFNVDPVEVLGRYYWTNNQADGKRAIKIFDTYDKIFQPHRCEFNLVTK